MKAVYKKRDDYKTKLDDKTKKLTKCESDSKDAKKTIDGLEGDVEDLKKDKEEIQKSWVNEAGLLWSSIQYRKTIEGILHG